MSLSDRRSFFRVPLLLFLATRFNRPHFDVSEFHLMTVHLVWIMLDYVGSHSLKWEALFVDDWSQGPITFLDHPGSLV